MILICRLQALFNGQLKRRAKLNVLVLFLTAT